MPRLPYAKNFRELEVYKEARVLAKEVFDVSMGFPKEKRTPLRTRHAEPRGRWETQYWSEVAFDSAYFDDSTRDDLIDHCLQKPQLTLLKSR